LEASSFSAPLLSPGACTDSIFGVQH
jgi:hypothetical protein